MRVDQESFIRWVGTFALTRGDAAVGPCSEESVAWCIRNALPRELVALFENHIPKTEIWAGAGALFAESDMVKWNDWFPEALHARLLIIGSAANGDHVVIDLRDGSTGYISHEDGWRHHPRKYFIPVSPSIGSYLHEVDSNSPRIPQDYWDAKSHPPTPDTQEHI
jgi:hypothetical protein